MLGEPETFASVRRASQAASMFGKGECLSAALSLRVRSPLESMFRMPSCRSLSLSGRGSVETLHLVSGPRAGLCRE